MPVASGARPAGNVTARFARRDQADSRSRAQLDLRRADLLALAEQRLGLPGGEAPLMSRDRFLTRALQLGRPATTIDQPPPVLLGRAGEAIARLLGMAGLEPVGARRRGRATDCGWPG